VKVLGVVALIDEGETDWKLISIDVTDPLADQMNNIGDVEKHFPGLLKVCLLTSIPLSYSFREGHRMVLDLRRRRQVGRNAAGCSIGFMIRLKACPSLLFLEGTASKTLEVFLLLKTAEMEAIATVEWFRIYKIPAGKPANQFGFNGEYKDREYAHNVIEATHDFWKNLIKEASPKLNTECFVEGAAHQATHQSAQAVLDASAAPAAASEIPSEVDKWHYIQA
ncbi:unnamed protein product, partial [Strongylus vulgaris]